jgi:polysaccharide pyruvyl transferase WcaK-like protein
MIISRAAMIFTRDRSCESLVARIANRSAAFCPDVAFTLESVEPESLTFVPAALTLDAQPFLIGLNVSGLLYMGGYTRQNMFGLRCDYKHLIDELTDRILRDTPATLLLIPHVFGSEEEEAAAASVLQRAHDRHPGRIFMLARPHTERELKWIIGRTHFFIGSRMHACIAALSQYVPAVGLAYSQKFLGVFESAGVGDAIIDLRTADVEDTLTRVLSALDRRAGLQTQLMSQIPAIQSDIRTCIARLLSPSSALSHRENLP